MSIFFCTLSDTHAVQLPPVAAWPPRMIFVAYSDGTARMVLAMDAANQPAPGGTLLCDGLVIHRRLVLGGPVRNALGLAAGDEMSWLLVNEGWLVDSRESFDQQVLLAMNAPFGE